nr:RNA-directed DNA polymerase, eukaryota [Tanacetum cinerariifolium]
EDTWKDSPSEGFNAMKILMGKLKYLKKSIREWNKSSMVCRKNIKAQYKKDLEAVNLIIDDGQRVEEDMRNRSDIIHKIQYCDKIDSLEMDLEIEVTNEKIKRAVWECGTDKAPGPDGFTFGFFRHFWYLVEQDVYEAWCKTKKKQALIFKVDFEKAYDSVRWDYHDEVLCKFGFGEKWRRWIQCCLHSSRGSIIINGSPTEEFQFGKGLKQGDQLFPFLFILIMESLHLSFQRVVDEGLFRGIKLHEMVNLSHMFYADDAVFVGQWSDSNISTAADKLGCLVLKTPFLYLGSMVGGAMYRLQTCNDIVDRVRRRLSKWKMKMLSVG